MTKIIRGVLLGLLTFAQVYKGPARDTDFDLGETLFFKSTFVFELFI